MIMKHFILRAEIEKIPDNLAQWLDGLVREQGMQIVIPTRVHMVEDEDNHGPTGSCNLSTSHAAFHIWDKKKPMLLQFDFFTCGELDQLKLFVVLTDDFGIKEAEVLILDRTQRLKIETRYISDAYLLPPEHEGDPNGNTRH